MRSGCRWEKGRLYPWGQCRGAAQAPHARPPRRCGAPTHGHVGGTAGAACLGLGIDETAADAEVTELDLAPLVQQDVRGLDVTVDHAVLLLQVVQSLHDLQRGRQEGTGDTRTGPGGGGPGRPTSLSGHSPPPSSCPGSARGWGPAPAS